MQVIHPDEIVRTTAETVVENRLSGWIVLAITLVGLFMLVDHECKSVQSKIEQQYLLEYSVPFQKIDGM